MSAQVPDPVRVLIVEDHDLLAQSLRLALNAEAMDVVVSALGTTEILAAAVSHRPHVVLLDLDLGPAGGDGALLVEPLAIDGARVVVLSGTGDQERLAGCLESGAYGFLAKSQSLDVLLDAVRAAAAGEPLVTDARRMQLLRDLREARADRRRDLAPFEALTPRERFVLAQAMDGRSAAEIASAAFVSEATVRTQIRGILGKLGVNSQLAAVAMARRVSWIGDS
jgi:DNA-binding NarL/FixJ family response regulator